MLKDHLYKYFSFKQFRNGQKEIIESVLNKKDTLVVMPTGGGKSICYQLPAMIMDGVAIVVSPLISLMKDQVDALEKIKIPATFINSSLSFDECNIRIDNALNGKCKLIYVAPERLENSYFISRLNHLHISFLAVDEAHCISEWGHDFRPAYLNIAKTINNINISHIVALTATATPDVQRDIVKVLNMNEPNLMIRGFDRSNLNYITEKTNDKLDRTCEIISKNKTGSTIVYCGSRRQTEEICQGLLNNDIQALTYHGGMKLEERKINQDKFINSEINVIVATNAFGMGIDKADVRNVIHCSLTSSVEAYYQEAGRAGRDDLPANCYLFYSNSDVKLQEYFISTSYPPIEDFEKIFEFLKAQDGMNIKQNDLQIANAVGITESKASNILTYFERNAMIRRQLMAENAKIKLCDDTQQLLTYINNSNKAKSNVLEAVLRSVTNEAMTRHVDINVDYLLRKYNIEEKAFYEAINSLQRSALLDFKYPISANSIIIEEDLLNFDNINIDFDNLYYRKSIAEEKLKIVQEYATTKDCKRNFILNYFNDDEYSGVCNRCSSCKKTKPKGIKNNETLQRILAAATELDGKFGRYILAEYLRGSKSDKILQYRLNNEKLYGVLSDMQQKDLIAEIDNAIEHQLLELSSGQYPVISISSAGKKFMKNDIQSLAIEYFNFPKINKQEKTVPQKSKHEVLNIILNALAELNGKYGRYMLVDYLRGSKSEKIKQYELDKKKLYGALSEMRRDDVVAEIDRAINDNLIVLSDGQYPVASISPTGKKMATHNAKKKNVSIEELPARIMNINSFFAEGYSIEEVAQKMKMNKGDIAYAIEEIVNKSSFLDWTHYANERSYYEVKNILDKFPYLLLKDMQMKLSSALDFSMLRIIAAFAKRENSSKK